MEDKKKMSKKSEIFITIALVLVALIICTIVILPEIKLNYVKKLCNEEYEQECNKLIKKYKKENKSFLGIDIYNPPVSIDSFSISTKVSEIETDYGYTIFFTNKSGMKVKSVTCVYQTGEVAKLFFSSKEYEFFAEEDDTEEHIMYGQIAPSYEQEDDYMETTIEFYDEQKGYITYIQKDYDIDVIKPSVHSWSNYYKDEYGYCMLITIDGSVNKADVKAEDYKSEYSVEEY